MKIMVTGCAGFIASHLCEFLIDKGHQVVGVDNFSSGKPENLADIQEDKNFLGCHKIDIRTPDVIEAIKEEKPDIIFHLAAVSRTPWAVEDPLYTYETNVVGSANVLEAARQAGVKKVVLASSNIVYAAQTPYKTSKLAMEQVARDYDDLYGLPTVCLRFSNVAGGHVGRQHPDNVLASLAKSKREQGKIFITGDGEQTRNFTHVLDVCEALWLAANTANENILGSEDLQRSTHWGPEKNVVRGTEIDIMHPKAWSLNEIAKFFDCPVEYIDDRKGDIKHLVMGIGPAKAKELLGFEAKRNLEDYIDTYTNV